MSTRGRRRLPGPARHVRRAEALRSGVPRLGSRLFPRPRIEAELERGSAVTLLRAPVGFGKTVAVVQWLTRSPRARASEVVWLTAHALGNTELWVRFAVELAGLEPHGTHPAPPARAANNTPDRDRVLTALRRLHRRLIVVIDDLSGDDRTPESLAEFLADEALHNPLLDLIVTTRRSNWAPRGVHEHDDLTIIPATRLLFTGNETARVLGLPAGEAELAAIMHERTGGWPGLVAEIAGTLSNPPLDHNSAAAAAESAALEYVHRKLPHRPREDGTSDDWLDFTTALTVPQLISTQLAQRLIDRDDVDHRIESLERNGLLTRRLLGGRTYYAWPAAARHALRSELAERDPQRFRALSAETARWLLHEYERPEVGLPHAVEAQDWGLVLEILDTTWPELLADNSGAMLEAIEALPPETIVMSPTVVALRDVLSRQRWGNSDDLLVQMANASILRDRRTASTLQQPERAHAFGHAIAIMIALRVRGDYAKALDFAATAENLATAIGGSAQLRPRLRAHHFTRAALQIGITQALAGRPVEALDSLQRATEMPDPRPGAPAHTAAAAVLALVAAVRGDAAIADRWRALSGDGEVAIWPRGIVARIRRLSDGLVAVERGDRGRAMAASASLTYDARFELGLEAVRAYLDAQVGLLWGDRLHSLGRLQDARGRLSPFLEPQSNLSAQLDAAEAELLIALRRGTEAELLLRNAQRSPETLTPLARLELLSGRPNDAVATVTAALSFPTGSHRRLAELYVIAAIGSHRAGARRDALDYVDFALATMRNTDGRRAFATVPRTELLGLVAGTAVEKSVEHALHGLPEPFPAEIDVISLTERERLVLRQLADGMNMQQMADDSFLSYNTIKTQMRRLYQKLGVRSREEAVARAREHRLLGPDEDTEPAARAN